MALGRGPDHRGHRAEAVVANAAGDRDRAADRLAEAIERAAAQGSHALAGRALRVAAEAEVAIRA